MVSATSEYQYKEAMAELIKEKKGILENLEKMKIRLVKVLKSK